MPAGRSWHPPGDGGAVRMRRAERDGGPRSSWAPPVAVGPRAERARFAREVLVRMGCGSAPPAILSVQQPFRTQITRCGQEFRKVRMQLMELELMPAEMCHNRMQFVAESPITVQDFTRCCPSQSSRKHNLCSQQQRCTASTTSTNHQYCRAHTCVSRCAAQPPLLAGPPPSRPPFLQGITHPLVGQEEEAKSLVK